MMIGDDKTINIAHIGHNTLLSNYASHKTLQLKHILHVLNMAKNLLKYILVCSRKPYLL